MKKLILIAVLSSGTLASASTDEICRIAGNKATTQTEVIQACATFVAQRMAIVEVSLNKFYDGLEAKYEECIANNGNCTAYKIRITSEDASGKRNTRFTSVDLTKWNELMEKANEGLQQAAQIANHQCLQAVSEKGAEECKEQFGSSQHTVDVLVNLSTFFMSSLLPSQMTHIDIGDVLAGKPLGGDGAIVIEIREALLSGINTPDFIADYVRDPIHVSQNVIRELTKGASNFLNNLCGDLCGGINVKF